MPQHYHPTRAVSTHLVSLTLTLAASILILLVVLYNAPLPANAHPEADDTQARWWLVHVTDNTAPRVVGVPIQHSNATTVPDVPGASSSEARQSTRQSADRYSANEGVDGRQMYGFGNWGWCEWHRDDPYGDATCRTKAFWNIPRDAMDSEVVGLNLPGSLRKSLATASFFLVLQAASCILRLLFLIVAWYGAPIQPMVSESCRPIPPRGISIADHYHYILINPGLAVSSVIFTFAWCIPSIAVSSIAVSKINQDYPNLDAEMGTGTVCLCVSLVCMIVASVVPVFGGLRVRQRRRIRG